MASLQFDLISPAKSFASLAASAVDLPASEGDMTAMPGHAALVATLKPGMVRAHADDGISEFLVTGGFAEVTAESTVILAEHVLPKGEVTRAIVEELVESAEEAAAGKEGAELDLAQKNVADTRALVGTLGL